MKTLKEPELSLDGKTLKDRAGDRTSFLLALFEKFDEDESGAIEVDELGKLMKSLGVHCDERVIKTVLEGIDVDKSGTIDKDEFVEFMSQIDDLKDLQHVLQFEASKSNTTRNIAACYFTVNFAMLFVFATMQVEPENEEEQSGFEEFSEIGLLITGTSFAASVFAFFIMPLIRIWIKRTLDERADKKKVKKSQKEEKEALEGPPRPKPRESVSGILHNPIARPIQPGQVEDDIPDPPDEPPPEWQSYRKKDAMGSFDEEMPAPPPPPFIGRGSPPPPAIDDQGPYRPPSRASSFSHESVRTPQSIKPGQLVLSQNSFNLQDASGNWQNERPVSGNQQNGRRAFSVHSLGYYARENYFAAQDLNEAREYSRGPPSSFNPYLAKREGSRQRPQSAPAGSRQTPRRPENIPMALTAGSSRAGTKQRPHSAAALTNYRY